MWTLFEPVHAVTYFAPEARSAFEAAGLRGFWRGYFAGRAAPLGPASAAVVTASFYNFAPAMVSRAVPGVWELVSPAKSALARQDGAIAALRRLLTGLEKEAAAAADRLAEVTGDLDCAGRVLAAANTALPEPDGALSAPDAAAARLWQAATVLREHRGDGHSAAMLSADIDGCETLVLRCALDMRREDIQPIRGWSDEQWEAARSRLAGRGLIGPDGELTAAGRETHAAAEGATDRAAGRPWARLGPAATKELAGVLPPSHRPAPPRFPTPARSGCLPPAPSPDEETAYGSAAGSPGLGGGGPGVVPVGQQGPQGRDERDGLVEHDVVTRGRDLDERGDAAEPVIHDLAHLPGQNAVLGPEQSHATIQPGEQGGAEMRPGEDPRVKLPRPAAAAARTDVSATWLVM